MSERDEAEALKILEELERRKVSKGGVRAVFEGFDPGKGSIERGVGEYIYRLHLHQLAGHEMGKEFQVVCMSGSVRNGKSRWAFTQGVDLVVNGELPAAHIPRVVWTVVPTLTPYYDSVRPEFELVMGWASEGGLILEKNESKQKYYLKAKDGRTPWEWVFMSAEDPDRLRAATIAAAHLTEAEKMEEEAFGNVMDRLVASAGPCWVETSPWGLGWVYRRLLERATKEMDFRGGSPVVSRREDGDRRVGVIRGVPIEANKALPPQAVADLRANASAETVRRQYDGEHFAAQGLVWNGFDPNRHIRSPKEGELEGWQIIAGHDFGFGHPEAHVFVATDGMRYWVVGEYREAGKTFREHAAAIKGTEWNSLVEYTYGDPAAAQARAEYQDLGIFMTPAENDVELGINCVAQLLESGRLLISEECKKLVGEIGRWMRNEKTGRPVKIGEDLADALRYCCFTHITHGGAALPHLSSGGLSGELVLQADEAEPEMMEQYQDDFMEKREGATEEWGDEGGGVREIV